MTLPVRTEDLSSDPRILIVEHDELTTATYARMLRLDGYKVETAFSAQDGLSQIASRHPDAILVDFHMPGLDGLEVVRRLRAREETRSTPVAIVTGDHTLEESVAGELRALGAELWFKPLWVDDLVRLVHALLAKRSG